MTTQEKVWVEAETTPDGVIVLSLVDVTKRRKLVDSKGKHNIFLKDISKLQNFPSKHIEALQLGYPVKFKMYESAYESMLGEADLEET